MWTSQISRPSRSNALGIDIDDDALAAEPPGRPADQLGVAHGRRVDGDLVRSRAQERADVVEAANPAADGQRHETDLGRPTDDVQQDRPIFVTGRDVEEHQLVGPFAIVPRGDLDRIAGVPEVQEVRPLDDTPMVDVQAGDDPLCQHAQPRPEIPGPTTIAGPTFAVPVRAFVLVAAYLRVFYKTGLHDPRCWKETEEPRPLKRPVAGNSWVR